MSYPRLWPADSGADGRPRWGPSVDRFGTKRSFDSGMRDRDPSRSCSRNTPAAVDNPVSSVQAVLPPARYWYSDHRNLNLGGGWKMANDQMVIPPSERYTRLKSVLFEYTERIATIRNT